MMKFLLKEKLCLVHPYLKNRSVEMRLGSVDDASDMFGVGWLFVNLGFYYNHRRRPFATATCFFSFDGNRSDKLRFFVHDEETIELLSGGGNYV